MTETQNPVCENPYCPYGREWDQGLPVTRNADDTVPLWARARSYYRRGGMCLNCIDDDNHERETGI